MDHTQRRVTVFHRVHDDPHCEQVINLINRLILVDHLPVNAEEMLDSSIHLCLYSRVLHVMLHLVDNRVHVFLPLTLLQIDLLHQIVIDLRLEIFQRQIIQLYLDLGDTKSLGDGSIDIHRLLRFLFLLLRLHVLQSTHIVEPVRKLDQNNPNILCHGQKHFSQILRLQFHLVSGVGQLPQFGHSVHQKGNL